MKQRREELRNDIRLLRKQIRAVRDERPTARSAQRLQELTAQERGLKIRLDEQLRLLAEFVVEEI